MAIGSAVKRTDAHSQASALSEKDDQGTLTGSRTRKTSRGLSRFWRFWTPRALPWQIWAVVMACVCLPGYENATPATPLQMTPGQLVRAVHESVVLIRTLGIGQKSEADLAGDPPKCQNAPSGGGTGFVIAATGYILTNDHVAAPCPQAWPNVPLKVYLSSGEAFDATLVGRDPATDLAVLKIPRTSLRPLPFADYTEIEVAQDVVAIGFPRLLGGGPTVTKGIVSAQGRSLDHLADLLQTDAAINGGNSGGPLLNLSGDVVGVNTTVLRVLVKGTQPSGELDIDVTTGMNFAVSSRIAARVSSDLIASGRVQRANVGVMDGVSISETGAITQTLAGRPFSVGVLVTAIQPGTPAANLLKVCDVIERLDSHAIASWGDLTNALIWLRSGQTVQIRYRRYPPDKCAALPEVPFTKLGSWEEVQERVRRNPQDPRARSADPWRAFTDEIRLRQGRILQAYQSEGEVKTSPIALQ